MVDLEETLYNVSEDVGVVELCANVSSPVNDCPIKFPFVVRLSTHDGSAGTVSISILCSTYSVMYIVVPDDYGSLNVSLMFAACDTRRCVNVNILSDFTDEPDDNFFLALNKTPGLHPRIFLQPVLGKIIIVDDGGGGGG